MNDGAELPAIDFSRLIRPEHAAIWLAGVLNSPLLVAKAEIADMLRDGVLESFAGCVWTSEEEDVGLAWQEGPDDGDVSADVQRNVKVEAWIWRWSRQWLADQADWRWRNGRFTAVHELDPFKRVLVRHVHFRSDQLLAAVRARYNSTRKISASLEANETNTGDTIFDDVSDEGPVKKARGRHSRGRAYARVFREIHRLKLAGEFRLTTFKKQELLVEHLVEASRGDNEQLSATVVRPLITALRAAGFLEP